MFRLIAIQLLKWKKQWKKAWKEASDPHVSTSYRNINIGNSTGTSSTKLDPEQEKRLWDTFDNSFKIMDNSFKIMDESFKHMDNIFKKNDKT